MSEDAWKWVIGLEDDEHLSCKVLEVDMVMLRVVYVFVSNTL